MNISGTWSQKTGLGDGWQQATGWWNQVLKDAIHAAEVACKAGAHVHLHFAEWENDEEVQNTNYWRIMGIH